MFLEILIFAVQKMAELNPQNQINFEQFIKAIKLASINVYTFPIYERAIQISVGDRNAVAVTLPLPDKASISHLKVNTPSFFMIQRSGAGFVRMLTQNELEQLLSKIQEEKDLQGKIRKAAEREGIKLEIDDDFLNAIRVLYVKKAEAFIEPQDSAGDSSNSQNHLDTYRNGTD